MLWTAGVFGTPRLHEPPRAPRSVVGVGVESRMTPSTSVSAAVSRLLRCGSGLGCPSGSWPSGTSILATESLLLLAILAAEYLVRVWLGRRQGGGPAHPEDVESDAETAPLPDQDPEQEYPGLGPELETELEPKPEPVAGVRQLMERLVETLVAGGLDDVALRPKHPHPEYNRVYKRHQPRLRSALTSLAYSLQMALARKPLSESETPGRAHAQLRAIILDLARDVAALDHVSARARRRSSTNGHLPGEVNNDFTSKAYEDILATAIVNKVMERSGCRSNQKHSNNNNFVGSFEIRVGSVDDSPDSCHSHSERLESPLEMRGDADLELDSEHSTDPLSLMIEECIEEVTTITASSSPSPTSSTSTDEGSGEDVRWARGRGPRRRRRRSHPAGHTLGSIPAPGSGPPSILAGISFLNKRVPFPELGVDIVDADWPLDRGGSESGSDPGSESPSESTGSWSDSQRCRRSPHPRPRPASCLELVTPLQSWEDNWLFQTPRQRKTATQYAHPVPVPMLVPNPSEDYRALIGDVDAEETSDLSECSDDVLEEVVLAGHHFHPRLVPESELHPDLHDELRLDLDLDPELRSLNPADLEGLAETCNLVLLKKVTDVTNDPLGRDLERIDKDAEVTIVYDTPTRREAPTPKRRPSPPHTPPPTPTTTQSFSFSREGDSREEVREDTSRVTTRDQNGDDVEEPAVAVSRANTELNEREVPTALPDRLAAEGSRDLATPPRPGTIAEREHRKWLEARPLPNNPYSPENIERRLRQRASNAGLPPTPACRGADEDGGPSPSPGIARHVALSVDPPDPKKYGRDFYINSGRLSDGAIRAPSPVHGAHTVAAQVSAAASNPGEDWRGAPASSVRTNGDGGAEETSASAHVRAGAPAPDPPEAQMAPSVKELAKQFLGQEEQNTKAKHTTPKEHKVVIVPKEAAPAPAPLRALGAEQRDRKTVRQVHSLTARSMSREFREGLRHLAGTGASSPAVRVQTLQHQQSQTQPQPRPDPEGARQPTDSES